MKGKATLESYQKMGLPHPDEVLSSFGGSRGESFPALTESEQEGGEAGSLPALTTE